MGMGEQFYKATPENGPKENGDRNENLLFSLNAS
jgi:hypothetical protein